MEQHTAKRIARVKPTLTRRTVEALEPADMPWIAWDDKLTGFGCRVQPSGIKSFVVNYRAGEGGRKAPNKRVVVGRYGRIAPDQARRKAQELLGRVAGGDDPAGDRADDRGLGLVNSGTAEVLGVRKGRVTFLLEEGRRLTLTPGDPQLRHLDHAWASTVHAFQGRTVDSVIAAMEANHPRLTTAKAFYVEISRARDRAELVADDAQALRERSGSGYRRAHLGPWRHRRESPTGTRTRARGRRESIA